MKMGEGGTKGDHRVITRISSKQSEALHLNYLSIAISQFRVSTELPDNLHGSLLSMAWQTSRSKILVAGIHCLPVTQF